MYLSDNVHFAVMLLLVILSTITQDILILEMKSSS